MCLPVTDDINAIFAGADQQALGTLLAKMGACGTLAVQCGAVQCSVHGACGHRASLFLWIGPVAVVLFAVLLNPFFCAADLSCVAALCLFLLITQPLSFAQRIIYHIFGRSPNPILCAAVERSLTSKLSDAREALLNVCVDSLKAYKQTMGSATGGLACPQSLMFLVPMVMGMLKHVCLMLCCWGR
jgi:hypothetical protein